MRVKITLGDEAVPLLMILNRLSIISWRVLYIGPHPYLLKDLDDEELDPSDFPFNLVRAALKNMP